MPRNIAILDTNILNYGFKAEYTNSVTEFLQHLAADYDLYTTQYSKFELFRGLVSSRVPAAKVFFESFTCIDMSGDIIIGAVGFIYNAAIITSDLNDFPRPYFSENSKTYRLIQSKRKATSIRIGILQPNIAYFNEMVGRVYPPQKVPQ